MALLVSQGPERATIEGHLSLHTVGNLLKPGIELIHQSSQTWQLDMSKVESVSSAGAALLLEWLKVAKQQNKTLTIQNMPESLKPILEISDLSALFAPLLRPSE